MWARSLCSPTHQHHRARGRPDRGAHADRHGVPEAQPVSESIYENVAYGLRVRGVTEPRLDRRQGRTGLARRGVMGRGERPAARAAARPLRRSAAAALHRARPRDGSGNPAVRRADSALDPIATGKHRGTDRRAERRRSPIVIVTHNMQQAARISKHTAFYVSRRSSIEYGATDQIFTNPQTKRTADYITGRFG